jgi:hypothetical protein
MSSTGMGVASVHETKALGPRSIRDEIMRLHNVGMYAIPVKLV